uniref:Uncharacterized protein n=1 Tax=Cacopsylla melanoneura TaxID=428564 RepID=A0A8D8Y6N2_9HEMI
MVPLVLYNSYQWCPYKIWSSALSSDSTLKSDDKKKLNKYLSGYYYYARLCKRYWCLKRGHHKPNIPEKKSPNKQPIRKSNIYLPYSLFTYLYNRLNDIRYLYRYYYT